MTQANEGRTLVRDAGVAELDQVSLLIKDAYQEYEAYFAPEDWDRYAWDIMDVRSRLDTSELIVAENSGGLVGAVTFYPNTSPSDQGGWPAGWTGIRLLAVHPDARGMGIGRVLMDECLRRSRLLSASALGLHTTELMAVAQGMYERMGFVRVPEYDFQPAPEMVVLGYRLDLKTAASGLDGYRGVRLRRPEKMDALVQGIHFFRVYRLGFNGVYCSFPW